MDDDETARHDSRGSPIATLSTQIDSRPAAPPSRSHATDERTAHARSRTLAMRASLVRSLAAAVEPVVAIAAPTTQSASLYVPPTALLADSPGHRAGRAATVFDGG